PPTTGPRRARPPSQTSAHVPGRSVVAVRGRVTVPCPASRTVSGWSTVRSTSMATPAKYQPIPPTTTQSSATVATAAAISARTRRRRRLGLVGAGTAGGRPLRRGVPPGGVPQGEDAHGEDAQGEGPHGDGPLGMGRHVMGRQLLLS